MDYLLLFFGLAVLIGFIIAAKVGKEREEHWREHEERLSQTEAVFNSLSLADEEISNDGWG